VGAPVCSNALFIGIRYDNFAPRKVTAFSGVPVHEFSCHPFKKKSLFCILYSPINIARFQTIEGITNPNPGTRKPILGEKKHVKNPTPKMPAAV
jgi:hypothetical protein